MTKQEILDKMDLQRRAYVLRLKAAQDKHLEVMDKLWIELKAIQMREVKGDTVAQTDPV